MRIDIFADFVCPWCFIGKRRLERAIAMRPDVPTAIVWHPFQLNPDLPQEGLEADAFFARKFGSSAIVKERRAAVAELGAAIGIAFSFDRIAREPNTLDAHRLLRLGTRQAKDDLIAEALFRAHFVEARDIGDRGTLLAIAVAAGIDAKVANEFVTGSAESDAVLAEERTARKLGINAVPCYVFERQYAVSGAQEPEFFLPIFDLVQSGARAAE